MSDDNLNDLFRDITGEEICQALWIPNCPSGNNAPAKRCRATAMALADELNLVSGRLQLEALIAGADDGNSAFDNLGLNYNSTVREALTIVEMVIAGVYNASLTDAAYVAERIYSFYEDENINAPYCVMDPIILSSGIAPQISPLSQDASEEEDMEENEEEVLENNNNENNRGENPELNPEQEQNENATTSEDVIMNEQSQIENATSSEEVAENEPTATSSEE